MDYRIRPATEADAIAICQIYNQGIEDRLATLETELRTADERRQWLTVRSPRHPVIVCELATPATSSNRPPTLLPDHAVPATTSPATTSNRPPTALPDHTGPATTSPATASNRPPTALPDHPAPATTVAGWASLNVFNARDAYRFVADISVYVERQWRGKGAGRVLLTRLIELGREHGYHKLVLSAFPFNPGGMALYNKLGFRTVGVYKEQGQLDGGWVDTIIMERLL